MESTTFLFQQFLSLFFSNAFALTLKHFHFILSQRKINARSLCMCYVWVKSMQRVSDELRDSFTYAMLTRDIIVVKTHEKPSTTDREKLRAHRARIFCWFWK